MLHEFLDFETSDVAALASLVETGLTRLTQAGRPSPARRRKILEAAHLFQAARRHPLGDVIIREAFTASDFPLTFGWFTDRQMLARYQTTPAAWQKFLKRSTLPDFRAAARDRMQGGNTPMKKLGTVEDYPNDSPLLGERDTSLQLGKYGRKYPIAWEAQVNDVLEQLTDLPKTLAEAARNTEQFLAASAYVANGDVYKSHTVKGQTYTNKSNAPLSIEALTTAITFMRNLRDDAGLPIYLGESLVLVTGTTLEMHAKRLLGAPNFVFYADQGSGFPQNSFATANYIAPITTQVTDYWLEFVDGTHGATSWYLFADPASLAAGEVAFLRGQEDPALYMQAPNAIRISEGGAMGGTASPLDGSFENDEIAYKMRHCVGAALNPKNWRATYWSDGTGS